MSISEAIGKVCASVNLMFIEVFKFVGHVHLQVTLCPIFNFRYEYKRLLQYSPEKRYEVLFISEKRLAEGMGVVGAWTKGGDVPLFV